MKFVTPPAIKSGDTIHIISPSGGLMPFAQVRASRAVHHLESLGYKVVIGRSAAKNDGYVSASVADRLHDIHTAFSDTNCSLIMASIGGNNANQLLPEIDYELIKANPKAFCGYSDITVLHLAIMAKTGMRTYYGPCLMTQFGEYPEVLPYTLEQFKLVLQHPGDGFSVQPSAEYTDEILDWFKGQDAKRPRRLTKNKGYKWLSPGKASGWALPVTLPSYNHVVNTEYSPDPNGAVLMLDIPEGASIHEGISLSEFDSWLTDLRNAKVLDKIKGLVVARPYKYDDEQTAELERILNRVCGDLHFPIVMNVDFGHTDPIITIPIGAELTLDSSKQSLIFAD